MPIGIFPEGFLVQRISLGMELEAKQTSRLCRRDSNTAFDDHANRGRRRQCMLTDPCNPLPLLSFSHSRLRHICRTTKLRQPAWEGRACFPFDSSILLIPMSYVYISLLFVLFLLPIWLSGKKKKVQGHSLVRLFVGLSIHTRFVSGAVAHCS